MKSFTTKPQVRGALAVKAVQKSLAAQKRFVSAVAAVRLTPELQQKAEGWAEQARQAKEAQFLDKYRNSASGS